MKGACLCGGEMSKNPHPQAGKPEALLEVGAVYVCIPCTVRTRHRWADRALKAESELSLVVKGAA